MSMLERITSPDDVRSLSDEEILELCAQIRQFLVDRVAKTGGHLGPNLGVVELTIALHRVFRSPQDVILWDTGHQAYVHKILTGRSDRFATLRKEGLATDEVASTATFLLSPRSTGINAQGIVVDAGMGVNYFDRELVERATRVTSGEGAPS